MQICFLKKRKTEFSLMIRIGKYTAKLTFLRYNNFGDKRTPLHRNGMAPIPKIYLMKTRKPGRIKALLLRPKTSTAAPVSAATSAGYCGVQKRRPQ